MPTQAVSTPYQRRPNLQPSDFLLGQKQNESRYVPTSLVPTEIAGDIQTDGLSLVFRYITPESPAPRKFRHGNVELELGRSTKKILRISISFKPTYSDLIWAMDEAIKTVKLAREVVEKPSMQKSYNLIIDILLHAKRDFNTHMKRELEDMFRRA